MARPSELYLCLSSAVALRRRKDLNGHFLWFPPLSLLFVLERKFQMADKQPLQGMGESFHELWWPLQAFPSLWLGFPLL